MFQHFSDVLDNKLQLAIGIVGIVTGLCFHLLPRLPKIISIANHNTNSTTEMKSASDIHVITYLCYIMSALYAVLTNDPLFLAFNVTGLVISLAYALITGSLPEDKLVRDATRDEIITALYWVVFCALIFSCSVKSRIFHGVVGTIAFLVVVCVGKLWFERRDVGPVWVLASSLVMILNGAIWVAYGVLVKDVFICVSSGIGCVAGVTGLVLCVKKNRINNSTVAPVGDNGDGIIV